MDIVVLCDDLTGANATGVKLTKKGFKTATVIHGLPLPESGYDALCLDTDSRYVTASQARNRVMAALKESSKIGQANMYSKRIDSTLRGNIGIEIEAMLEFLEEDAIAIVVSSFPDSGRTTIGGFLLVDNVPLQQTDVATDPIRPLTTSKVEEMIHLQTDLPITTLGLDVVLEGQEKLEQEINRVKQHFKIICIDAVTDEHIDLIADVVNNIQTPVLSVDPGPFTAAYANRKVDHAQKSQKYLITIGSVTSQTGLQIDYFTQKTKVKPIYVNPANLATFTEKWSHEVNRVVQEAEDTLQHTDILLITTYHPGHNILDLSSMAVKEDTTEGGLAKRITDGLGAISRRVLEKNRDVFKGCYLSGGDVTASVGSITRAHGIELHDEIMPLAAFGSFIDGYLDGMPVVTKGGMIGDKKALYTCMNYLISSTKNT
ncbi:four-carbon acid sugar kinase family protein [Bacillaceae bacterium SIJ1]|uniref:four-carbon acid sugar kinase family protein n=1 Tax=Litoribacterium kuwaitense TaxID=1398745 RepID=UPI0013EC6AC4|nr:four-carbon acid sugar kinase family protein [Litoribacterium kuwaitense]NGP45158.1 four-carbon acid sugar kinase family protein [Litoribacterium kuwaitense]